MNIITLASRNVRRNWQRSLVTTLAMAFACTIIIFYGALMEGMVRGSEHNAVAMSSGDIQIHAEDYRDDPDLYKRITDPNALTYKIREAGFRAAARIYGFGLMATNSSSSGVQLRGLDLQHEQEVSEIDQHLMSGTWLRNDDAHGVVIGKKLARQLAVALGDELTFIGQTADGYMANDIFKVRGILKAVSTAIDSAGVFMPEESLRELLTLPEGAHEIVVIRDDSTVDLKVATQEIAALAPGYEVLNWQQLMPVIARFLETANVQTLIMMIFTYIAVASVVLNAMLMSVFERIHEFGVMKAIGVRPWQLVRLIYAETILQTCIASLFSLGAGWLIASHYQKHGMDMSALAGDISFAGIAMDPIWYAYITPEVLITPILFLFILAALAVIYPAIKVALIRPLDAIHYQ